MLNIVIPMAGRGIRFKDTDHEEPKPLIKVFEGRPMIQFVVQCLTPSIDHRFIFICLKRHDDQYDLDGVFSSLTSNYEKVLIDDVTEGPACTVLQAKSFYDNGSPMLTACADDFVDTDIDAFLRFSHQNEAAGTVMTYPGNNSAGSSARIDNAGYITHVAEKKIVGPNTTVGIYFFKEGRYFVEAAESMIAKDQRANGEFYVSPVFNEMIVRGKSVRAYPIETQDMHSMGTPSALRKFQDKLRSTPEFIC